MYVCGSKVMWFRGRNHDSAGFLPLHHYIDKTWQWLKLKNDELPYDPGSRWCLKCVWTVRADCWTQTRLLHLSASADDWASESSELESIKEEPWPYTHTHTRTHRHNHSGFQSTTCSFFFFKFLVMTNQNQLAPTPFLAAVFFLIHLLIQQISTSTSVYMGTLYYQSVQWHGLRWGTMICFTMLLMQNESSKPFITPLL